MYDLKFLLRSCVPFLSCYLVITYPNLKRTVCFMVKYNVIILWLKLVWFSTYTNGQYPTFVLPKLGVVRDGLETKHYL